MYSYKLVKAPGECAAGCGTTVTKRVAGHYFREPMCDTCFSAAAPELDMVLRALQPVISVRFLEARSTAVCANCGDRLTGRIAAFHGGDPLCLGCVREHSPEVAALLLLEEAALEAADAGQHAADLLDVALSYAKALYRLDEDHPRTPLSEQSSECEPEVDEPEVESCPPTRPRVKESK